MKRDLFHLFPVVWLLACLPFMGKSQSYHFQKFSVEDGLPFIHTYCINQDTSGYLWVGGYGGLSKFDGINFTNYTRTDGLTSNRITAISKAFDGTLWIGSMKGVSVIENAQPVPLEIQGLSIQQGVTALSALDSSMFLATAKSLFSIRKVDNQFQATEIAPNFEVNCFYKQNNKLWIGSKEGLFSWEGDSLLPERDVNRFELSVQDIICINDTLWVATNNGLIRKTAGEIKTFNFFDGLPSNNIRSLETDENGLLWLATANGLARRDGQTFKVFFVDNSANSNDIIQLFKDRESNIWIATYEGIYKLNSQRFLHYSFKDGLPAHFIYGIHRDRKKQLWIGSRSKGVFKYSQNSFTAYNTSHGLASNRVGPIVDFQDQVYIGTSRGLSIFDLKTNQFIKNKLTRYTGKNEVNDIFIDSTDASVYLAHKTHITVLNGSNISRLKLALPAQSEIWSIWKDSNASIWVGTYEGGLHRLRPDGKLINVGDEWGIEIESALDILSTSPDDLWFATFQGVYHYNLANKNLQQISVSNGLNSPLVYSLVKDYKNQLWVGTNQGINRIDLDTYGQNIEKISVSHFGKADGFIGVECNTHGAWADKSGTLWFGTVNGLTEYIGDTASHGDIQNKTFITGIKLFYNDTLLPNESVLPHNQNQISFTFKGICLSNPKKVKYKFKLDGYDQKWSPAIQERVASYSNLKPGDYTFQVISSNENGYYNRVPTTFSFSIATPYYQRFWFIALSILLFSAIVFGVFSLRIQSLKSKAALERNLDNLKLQALRSQMNPHFIFNSLNSIQFYINSNEKKQANRYLTKFAKLMRLILNNSKSPFVNLEKDIEAVQLYIEMEQIRFENGFDFTISIDPALNQSKIQIPPMLIQPYVENSINHGFTRLTRKGTIKIKLESMGRDVVRCIIEDNGIGRKAAEAIKMKKRKIHQSAAMGITQGRLETLQTKYKDELKISIEDLYKANEPAGTRVTLTIPVINLIN